MLNRRLWRTSKTTSHRFPCWTRAIDTTADIGGVVLVESTPTDFGRIAAQTAKQVILQRIREAERDAILQRYQGRVGEIVHCTIRSVDYGSGTVTCTIDGKAEATLLKEDQIATERYRANNKLRCYLVEVDKGSRGPVIRLSRTHRGLLRRLLEQEVPEIYNGAVEIKSIASRASGPRWLWPPCSRAWTRLDHASECAACVSRPLSTS